MDNLGRGVAAALRYSTDAARQSLEATDDLRRRIAELELTVANRLEDEAPPPAEAFSPSSPPPAAFSPGSVRREWGTSASTAWTAKARSEAAAKPTAAPAPRLATSANDTVPSARAARARAPLRRVRRGERAARARARR